MRDTTEKVGSNTIENIAYEVRNNQPTLVDKCFQVSENIQELFERRYGIQLGVRELQIGEKRATHFVNTLPMSEYAESHNKGKLLIDATIQQFCLSNKNQDYVNVGLDHIDNLPAIALYEPGCEERIVWYTKPNNPSLVGELNL